MPYFIRLTIEAVIFASLIYISCEGSWRAEHGLRQWFLDRPGDHTEYGRDSSFLRVLLDIPVVFYILAAAVVYLLFAGPLQQELYYFHIIRRISPQSLLSVPDPGSPASAQTYLQPCMCTALDFPSVPGTDMVPVQHF